MSKSKAILLGITTTANDRPVARAALNVVALNAWARAEDIFDYRRWWSNIDLEVVPGDLLQIASALETLAHDLRAQLEKVKP